MRLKILILIVLIFSFVSTQAQKSYQIDSVQLSVANQNYIYARHCREVKRELFAQVARYENLTDLQHLEINALQQSDSLCSVKVSILEKNAITERKMAKKNKRKAFWNGMLIGGSVIIILEAVALLTLL